MIYKINPDEILFHASSVGVLMTEGRGSSITEKQLDKIKQLEYKRENPDPLLTEKQLDKLKELRQEQLDKSKDNKQLSQGKQSLLTSLSEKENKFKELTKAEEDELQRLIEKRDKPYELSKTAKSYIESMYDKIENNYNEPVITDELLKGLMNEEDSISLLELHLPQEDFRIKNKEHFKNDYFVGTPDLILETEGVVEDVKTSWTLKTFKNASVSELYYCQLQVYMKLLNDHYKGRNSFEKARLVYCLTSTPRSIYEKLKSRLYFKFNFDNEYDSEEETKIKEDLYKEASDQLEDIHKVGHIPQENRIKIFEVKFDPEYIKELENRVKLAREHYKTLKMPSANKIIEFER